MPKLKKSVLSSDTTWNVGEAGLGTVPVVLILVRILANAFPEILGGDLEQGALVTVLSAVGTALGGRLLAWFKARRGRRVFSNVLVPLLLIPALAFAAGGCVTTTGPDGAVERRVDERAILFAVDLGIRYGPEVYAMGLDLYDAMLEREVAADQARVAAAQARIDLILAAMDRLTGRVERDAVEQDVDTLFRKARDGPCVSQ